MRKTFLTLLAGTVLVAGQALAGGNDMTQPASDDVGIWAYPAKVNYCPAGLQPVVIGGVVCCGQPNRTGYQTNPAPKPRASYVSYGKGYSDTVVYEKGQ